jgi:hypothetical protein
MCTAAAGIRPVMGHGVPPTRLQYRHVCMLASLGVVALGG